MKKTIWAVVSVAVLAGAIGYIKRPRVSPETPGAPGVETVSAPESEPPTKTAPISADPQPQPLLASSPQPAPVRQATNPGPDSTRPALDAAMLNQTLEMLLSPQIAYGQKQSAWKQLRDGGKLDQAIKELEQRMAANPQSAECPAALAQACFQKCATLQDVREQAILGMQADKILDMALNLDPSNWEARFTKAVALTHWPASMNKGEEVVQHFVTLIQQQEAQPAQPHFADSYALLGDQYQKSGHGDDARAVWERGAGLFPNHDGLRQRLTGGLAARGQ